jgi:small subunit ribosomal protein S19
MTIKEFTYRGKSLEEIKKMDVREFAKLLPSRKRRSVLRQSERIEAFIKNCRKKIEKNKKIKTHLRNIIITPQLIGMSIQIHSGKEFTPIMITQEMLGHYLGEFVLTRSKVEHSAPGIGATRSSAALSVK